MIELEWRFEPQFHSTGRDRKVFLCYSLPSWSKALFTVTLENSLPPRNAEVITNGHEAFKESVKFIDRAIDPEHELSETKDTFENKIREHNNNHNDEEITPV